MRIIQIFADDHEAIYTFNEHITDKEIKTFWSEFEDSDFESFEEFVQENYPIAECERFWLDSEIYI